MKLTWVSRSTEYSERNVVLPVPVLPVKTVSSPLRNPRRVSLSPSNRFHLVPSICSKCAISRKTSWRSESNVVINSCATGFMLSFKI